jgi:thiol-disulfide isomerase/thioredoxin
MKKLVIAIVLISSCLFVRAQKDTTLAPYLQVPIVPPFKILLTDSLWFAKKDLPKKKYVVITYFNPECGHCQDEAQELAKNMGKFKKAFFVMAAYKDVDLIQQFIERFGLGNYPNLKIGRDTQYFLPVFYNVQTTPFTAVYNKKGELLKAFEKGMTVEELEKLVK